MNDGKRDNLFYLNEFHLNGKSDVPESTIKSAFSAEKIELLLRVLYNESSHEELQTFEQNLSASEREEYHTLQNLILRINAGLGEDLQSTINNTFYEQQWRNLMAHIQSFKQPVMPQMPHYNTSVRYGAVELLQFIPKATTRGFTAAASILLVFLLGYTGFMTYSSTRIKRGPAVNKMKLTNLPPPPAVTEAAPPPPPTAAGPAARAGTPVPVPDALIAPDVKEFANVDEISRASTTGGDGTDTGYLGLASDVDTEVREEEVDPYAFVPVEKEPYIDIKDLQRKVVYPDLAKRAGIEGKVNIRVLVGKNGVPKKHIIESSDSDLLNEAAVRAVMGSVFTPAIQNNQPIDCWVSIPIVFRLR
jgi:protein TonB